MKISVNHTTDTRVVVSIIVDKEELADAHTVALRKLSKTVKVPGFRKGHVPITVAEKHVDPMQLAEETLENALSKAVAQGFLKENLQALERPQVEVKKYVPSESLEFTAEADVLPKITLGDYKTLKSTIKPVAVEDKDVDEVLERIQRGFAIKADSDQPAEMTDEVTIDFVGTMNGKAFDGGSSADYQLALGSQSFIPGFEEAIVGHKVGEKFEIPLKFPKEYHSKELAGKDVVFTVTLKNVQKLTLPELNDELAAKVGEFTDIEALKADIKSEITSQKNREAADAIRDDFVKQLVEKSTVTAPKVLVDDQLQSIEQDMVQNLMYQGGSLEQYIDSKGYKDKEEWVEKEAKAAAEMRVKAGLVLAELSKAEKVEATADELAERVNHYKQQYGNSPDMTKRFDEPEVQRSIANELLTSKTVDRLVEINS